MTHGIGRRAHPLAGRRAITWLTFAGSSDRPMGLQHYELSVLAALRATDQQEWTFTPRTVTSLRSATPADVRIPVGALARAPVPVARALGRWTCRGASAVHRFDLRLPPSGTSEVVTVHDLPPLRFDDEGSLPSWSCDSARRARLVICPSAFAAAEVTELLGVSDVEVVPNGVNPVFWLTDEPERTQAGVPSRYVLHVGGASRRKNLGALGAAWREASSRLPDVWLVLVGPLDARRTEAVRGCPRVVALGYVPPKHIARLMAGALLVVVPSLYEGFGLPALEAMASGAPVVAARAGALPEVCGDAAVLVSPTAQGIAEALVRTAQDKEHRAELSRLGRARAAPFTWAASAAGHLRAYARAFG